MVRRSTLLFNVIPSSQPICDHALLTRNDTRVLLALVVALLNAGNGLEVLWVLLTTLAFALFLIFLVRPLYRRLCFATGSIQNGPTPLLMTVTLVMVLASAFVTDIIGVHAIFGGFLAGVIIPHDGDLATKIAEKIEDIVNIIFLPLVSTSSFTRVHVAYAGTNHCHFFIDIHHVDGYSTLHCPDCKHKLAFLILERCGDTSF